jgi:CheY-like chemotaxis protein
MLTALIVEDEPEANKLLCSLLQLRGYRTESAYSGAQAIEKVRECSPDIVLLDLMLPDTDGYRVCRELKAPGPGTGPGQALPVIIVTARLAAENRIESFAAGADDYVPKPYTPDQIFDALDQAIAWKDKIDAPVFEGRVLLDRRDDGETLRALAQLRSLMSARTSLLADEIDLITKAIHSIWASAYDWSRGRRLDRVAALDYSLTAARLLLTIHDEANWLSQAAKTRTELGTMLEHKVFDEIRIDEPAKSLTIEKLLGRPE